MNIYEKLTAVQNELITPKNKRNKFAKFNYRSAEDILEAVKPLLLEHKLTQIINDDVVKIDERFYIKSTISLFNNEQMEEMIITSALAREPEIKPKMDESQTTGSASSYARKYALAGLYALDDAKQDNNIEVDSQDNRNYKDNNTKKNSNATNQDKLSEKQLATLKGVADKDKQKLVILFKSAGIEMKALEELSKQEATTLIGKLYNK